MPVPSPGRGSKMKKALSISVVPSRDGPRAACARPVDIAAQGGSLSPAHPARPSTRLSSGGGRRHTRNGCCLNHRRGHCAGAMSSQAPQQVVKEQSMACSTITAGTENQKNKAKQKARNLAVPGPLRRELGRECAYALPPPGGQRSSSRSCAHKSAAARHGSRRSTACGATTATRTSARPGAGRRLVKVVAAFMASFGERAIGRNGSSRNRNGIDCK